MQTQKQINTFMSESSKIKHSEGKCYKQIWNESEPTSQIKAPTPTYIIIRTPDHLTI